MTEQTPTPAPSAEERLIAAIQELAEAGNTSAITDALCLLVEHYDRYAATHKESALVEAVERTIERLDLQLLKLAAMAAKG
jgi:hypothetical protein